MMRCKNEKLANKVLAESVSDMQASQGLHMVQCRNEKLAW